MAGNPGRMDPVPELPEVEALVRFMDEHTRGLEILSCDLSSIAALEDLRPTLGLDRGLSHPRVVTDAASTCAATPIMGG